MDGLSVSATSEETWITGVKISGNTVNYNVAENNSGAVRTGMIKITYGPITKYFSVTQTYSATNITFTPTSQSTDYAAKNLSFTFSIINPRQGVSSSVSTTETWITEIKLSGTTVSYKVTENKTEVSRTGKISVNYGPLTKDFSIKQDLYPVINGHEYVDLGLSVKWATCNVGASKPEDYGGYYQWAGTWDVWYEGIYLDFSNCPYHTGSNEQTGWTKYVPSNRSSYWSGTGNPDNKTVLDPSDDVASGIWKGTWRMPTYGEWTELLNTSYCSWTWTTINGINGYKVQSKRPGYTDNWIFLPAAGFRGGDHLDGVGSYGLYWSSSLYTFSTPDHARQVLFDSSSINDDHLTPFLSYRFYGQSVRPVSD
ncbi:MAG: hypothetical protein MJZ35_09170 [Bacteroidaceae bacterium]|nr:hypothetical protein [Bacteroidaceae bacterium]